MTLTPRTRAPTPTTRWPASPRLSAELSSGGKTYIFLLEDPEGFEAQTGALQYLDGTVPDDPETTDADWREMVYRWTDCPVLTGLDLGGYEGLTLMDDVTGTNQSVLAHLYGGTPRRLGRKAGPDLRGLRRAVGHPDRRGCLHRRRMSRALPPLKGHLRKKGAAPAQTPPLPDNPYKPFFSRRIAALRSWRGKGSCNSQAFPPRGCARRRVSERNRRRRLLARRLKVVPQHRIGVSSPYCPFL